MLPCQSFSGESAPRYSRYRLDLADSYSAAWQNISHWPGSELDPLHCDVIMARYEQFTGQTAVLAAGRGSPPTEGPVPNDKPVRAA